MLEGFDPNAIHDVEGARQAIVQLLNLVEALASDNRELRDENQRLRDEINRLKEEIRGGKFIEVPLFSQHEWGKKDLLEMGNLLAAELFPELAGGKQK